MRNGGSSDSLQIPHSATPHVWIPTIFFPVFLGFPFRLFLGGMEVCQCSLRKVAACSAGGLSLPFFTSPSYPTGVSTTLCGAFPDAKLGVGRG